MRRVIRDELAPRVLPAVASSIVAPKGLSALTLVRSDANGHAPRAVVRWPSVFDDAASPIVRFEVHL